MYNNKGFSKILTLLVTGGILLGVLMIYKNNIEKSHLPQQTPLLTPIKKRSNTTNIIKSTELAKSIDEKGEPLEKTANFGIKDPDIYTVIKLNDFTPPINISYIVLRDGNYVDFEGSELTQKTNYLNFNIALNSNGNRLPGTYIEKIYVNGILENAIVFRITQ